MVQYFIRRDKSYADFQFNGVDIALIAVKRHADVIVMWLAANKLCDKLYPMTGMNIMHHAIIENAYSLIHMIVVKVKVVDLHAKTKSGITLSQLSIRYSIAPIAHIFMKLSQASDRHNYLVDILSYSKDECLRKWATSELRDIHMDEVRALFYNNPSIPLFLVKQLMCEYTFNSHSVYDLSSGLLNNFIDEPLLSFSNDDFVNFFEFWVGEHRIVEGNIAVFNFCDGDDDRWKVVEDYQCDHLVFLLVVFIVNNRLDALIWLFDLWDNAVVESISQHNSNYFLDSNCLFIGEVAKFIEAGATALQRCKKYYCLHFFPKILTVRY